MQYPRCTVGLVRTGTERLRKGPTSMRVISGSVAAAALAVVMCAGCSQGASTAQASGGEAQGQVITAVGCPMTPTPGCTSITANGKTYDVSDAGLDLSRGVGISLTGRAAGEVTACGP